MARVVLVHGAWHGRWCWERVATELATLGYEPVVIDLPAHGARRDEPARSLAHYCDAVVSHLKQGDVLVGHSMGGTVTTTAAALVPDRIKALVYLAAYVPVQGEQMATILAGALNGLDGELAVTANEVRVASLEAATSLFYDDCDPMDARLADEQLVPEPLAPLLGPIELAGFHPSKLPCRYVACLRDRILPVAMQYEMASRLGITADAIDTAHSPFLNRPKELARLLVGEASP